MLAKLTKRFCHWSRNTWRLLTAFTWRRLSMENTRTTVTNSRCKESRSTTWLSATETLLTPSTTSFVCPTSTCPISSTYTPKPSTTSFASPTSSLTGTSRGALSDWHGWPLPRVGPKAKITPFITTPPISIVTTSIFAYRCLWWYLWDLQELQRKHKQQSEHNKEEFEYRDHYLRQLQLEGPSESVSTYPCSRDWPQLWVSGKHLTVPPPFTVPCFKYVSIF